MNRHKSKRNIIFPRRFLEFSAMDEFICIHIYKDWKLYILKSKGNVLWFKKEIKYKYISTIFNPAKRKIFNVEDVFLDDVNFLSTAPR